MLRKAFGLFVVAFALAACDVSGLVPDEHLNFAKRVVTMVQTQDSAGLQSVADPALWAQLPDDIRRRMAAVFPSEPPGSITVSNWKSNYNNGWSDVQMVMLYKYSRQDVQVTIGFRSAGTRNILTMIYVLPINGPLTAPGQPAPQSGPPAMPSQPQPQDQPQDGKSTTL